MFVLFDFRQIIYNFTCFLSKIDGAKGGTYSA